MSREQEPSVAGSMGAAAWRSGVLTLLGVVLLLGGGLVMAVVLAQATAERWSRVALTAAFVPIVITVLGRRRFGIRARGVTFVLATLAIECITARQFGPTVAVPITLMIAAIAATLVLGRKAGLATALLGAVCFIAICIPHRDELRVRFAADMAHSVSFLRMALTMTTGAILIVLTLADVLKRLESGLEEARGALTAARQQQAERERTEIELRESEQRLRMVMEGAAIAPWTIDLRTQQVTWGSNAGRALGFPEDRLPKDMNEVLRLVRPEDRAVIEARMNSVPDGPRPPIDLRLTLPDGREVWVESRSLRAMRPEGPVSMGTLVNITDRRRAAEALRAREAALEASRLKSEFVANISHEIRTPMNAVSGLTYLLAQTDLSEKQRSYVERIQAATRALLEVINDVLDMSKIEAGRLVIEARPFRLPDVTARVCDLLAARAEEKGIALSFAVAPGLPEVVVGDAMRTGQVLLNLVGNAVKFTERGGVTTTVEAAPADTGLRLRFAVTDTGIGLPADRLADIFEPFMQADGSTTRRFGGTGLGLTISKRIVEAMNGTIEVSSREGQGSTFAFTIPLGLAKPDEAAAVVPRCGPSVAPATEPAPAIGDDRLDGLRVLLVDDAPINQEVAREILESAGAQVVIAENGLAAVRMFTDQDGAFDAVLMDVQMPIMDGYEATRTLRRLPLGRTVPIIAMTAHAFDSERQRCTEAGMVDYVPKPFDPDHLIAALRTWGRSA